MYVDTKFQINAKTFDVQAFVDSGNTFHNCISEAACLRLGIQLHQLKSSPHPHVRQAGGGATLQVLGKLPDHISANGFRIHGLKRFFPLQDFFVLRGLNHDFNIALEFLQKYKFHINLEYNSLDAKENQHTIHIPFISKKKLSFSLQKITPLVPEQGILVRPGQKIKVLSSGTMANSEFFPREPNFSSAEAKSRSDLREIDFLTDP